MRIIARTGKRLRSEHFDVRVVASLSRLDHARVGLVIPKHGKSGVDRNRLKRRMRELCRTLILPEAPALDLVIHARPSAYRVAFDELAKIVHQLSGQLPRMAQRLAAVDESAAPDRRPPPDERPPV